MPIGTEWARRAIAAALLLDRHGMRGLMARPRALQVEAGSGFLVVFVATVRVVSKKAAPLLLYCAYWP